MTTCPGHCDGRYANVLTKFGKKKTATRLTLTSADEDFVAVGAFECRGLDITEWHAGGGFTVTADSGEAFEDVDMVEGDWYEVTEGGEPVGVEALEFKIERA